MTKTKICALCERSLPYVKGELDPAVKYSSWTKAHYCPERDRGRCRELRAKALRLEPSETPVVTRPVGDKTNKKKIRRGSI